MMCGYIWLSTKFGDKVGTDTVGNEYFENTSGDYQFGQHRWVEYKVSIRRLLIVT